MVNHICITIQNEGVMNEEVRKEIALYNKAFI